MSDPELADLRSLARATSDFFGMGEVRDLMFHVQEHRFDLRTISRHLGVLGLEFGGLLISNRNAVRDFYQHYPARSQWLDLECWAEFETRYPDTFRGMYQFYCLKPGPELTKRDRAIVDDGRRPV